MILLRFRVAVLCTLFSLLSTFPTMADELPPEQKYELGQASMRHEGVPKGTVTTHEWRDSKVFPGTVRRYYVYVPAQYNATQKEGAEPAALMVFQDGHAYVSETGDFRVPIVFDNLIAAGDMPVTIGVFIDPGHLKKELPPEPGWQPEPENRSFEYDTLSDAYSRLLLDEILPAVAKEHPFSDDPNMHAICGISSGGICAFTVAWQRPDAFRKVLSHVGSFTDIRGGYAYPALVRKPPGNQDKPLRVFLQDGDHDLNNQHGNWYLGNLQLANSLEFRNYDVKTEFGHGAHNGNHGGAILPDSLRWLWRDWKAE